MLGHVDIIHTEIIKSINIISTYEEINASYGHPSSSEAWYLGVIITAPMENIRYLKQDNKTLIHSWRDIFP